MFLADIHYDGSRFVPVWDEPPSDAQASYVADYLARVSGYRPIAFYQGSPVLSLYQPPLASKPGVRSLNQRLQRRFGNCRLPATATVAVNKACQCFCDHCSAVFYNTASRREMDPHVLFDALAESVELGVTMLILLGGEPLLKKGLSKLIRSVPKDLSCVILFTNGEFLTPDRCAELKASGLMGLFVSLDSDLASEHDQFRKRKGLFQKACEGLVNARKAGLVCGISSYLSPERLAQEGFQKMMELGKTLGVHEVTFFDAIPSGRWLRSEGCLLGPSDRQQIQKLVREFRHRPGYPGIAAQSTMTSEGGSAFCFAANTQFYLNALGDVCPCDFTPLTVGRYPESSIAQLWQVMIDSEAYRCRSKVCRMQDREFRKQWIETIPEGASLPYRMV